jgi:Sulfotransferase domain
MQWFQAGRDDIDVDAFNALYRICRGMFTIHHDLEDQPTPNPITGTASKEDMEAILRDHGAALDYPVGIAFAELYAAYPDAKYILVRNDKSTTLY